MDTLAMSMEQLDSDLLDETGFNDNQITNIVSELESSVAHEAVKESFHIEIPCLDRDDQEQIYAKLKDMGFEPKRGFR